MAKPISKQEGNAKMLADELRQWHKDEKSQRTWWQRHARRLRRQALKRRLAAEGE